MNSLKTGSTIYIAGPMRGYPVFNFKRFFYFQERFEQSGYRVINPAEEDCKRWIDTGWCFSADKWREVLDFDKEMIRNHADGLFMLKGWEDSEGANEEYQLAKELGLPVFFEEKEVRCSQTDNEECR